MRPWDAYTDDRIGLMDHLGIDTFLVLGFCIGDPSFGTCCDGRPIVLPLPCWLVLPDDIPAHPYAVAMESVLLAPKSEVSLFPWKKPKNRIPLAVRQVRSFLRAHQPVATAG